MKCKSAMSAPAALREWATDELAKMEARLKAKGAVKDMGSNGGHVRRHQGGRCPASPPVSTHMYAHVDLYMHFASVF
jgi:hypothetical protein